ncbi:MAG TPA: maltotransferase domain-containing protein, partial [Ramlibacter sp.]|nr:maltotransferase domain-containing protein [Ramlibacter sp.]
MPDSVVHPRTVAEHGQDGRIRAVVDAVLPAVDGGRFAAKCVAGEPFEVTAHCFTDGHDVVAARLCWRRAGGAWQEVAMQALPNDVWTATFVPPELGRYEYTVEAWVDPFDTWRHDMTRRVEAADLRIAARVGAQEI